MGRIFTENPFQKTNFKWRGKSLETLAYYVGFCRRSYVIGCLACQIACEILACAKFEICSNCLDGKKLDIFTRVFTLSSSVLLFQRSPENCKVVRLINYLPR